MKNLEKLGKVLGKNDQKSIRGGWGDLQCVPTFCDTADDCLTDGCGFSQAICASGFCFVF